MSTVKVVWLEDANDCETCGGSFAQGGAIYIDGEEVKRLQPYAHCYDSVSFNEDTVLHELENYFSIDQELKTRLLDEEKYRWDVEELYRELLSALGHTLIIQHDTSEDTDGQKVIYIVKANNSAYGGDIVNLMAFDDEKDAAAQADYLNRRREKYAPIESKISKFIVKYMENNPQPVFTPENDQAKDAYLKFMDKSSAWVAAHDAAMNKLLVELGVAHESAEEFEEFQRVGGSQTSFFVEELEFRQSGS